MKKRTTDRCQLPEAPPSPPSASVENTLSLDVSVQKKRKVSVEDDRSKSEPASDPLLEIDNLRKGLGRLEDILKASTQINSTDSSKYDDNTHTNQFSLVPLVTTHCRLENLDEILSILPCQSDCEILIEYLLQETDWICICVGVQWLHPIWCRFVNGGRVTRTESIVLVAAIAVAAVLLDEAPHLYYQTAASLTLLHNTLLDHVIKYISIHEDGTSKQHSSSNHYDSLNKLLICALFYDYVRSGPGKTYCWPLIKGNLFPLVQSLTLTDEESSPFWQGLNDIQKEFARRIVWHFVVCDRWGNMYLDEGIVSPFCASEIKVKHPQWIRTSLSVPFVPTPSLQNTDEPVQFKSPSKIVPRLFRTKQEHEVEDVPIFTELFIGLSTHIPLVADYVVKIASWNSQRKTRVESAFVGKVDHRREALLHQGIVLFNDLKEWAKSIQPYCDEAETLDPHDYFACRRANQANVLHSAHRQILNVVLNTWVTEEASTNIVDSPLLFELQREAYMNAKDAVQSIEVTRSLLSCGKVLHVPWAALGFYNAATTLAIPLLEKEKEKEGERMDHRVDADFASTGSSHRNSVASPFSSHLGSSSSWSDVRTSSISSPSSSSNTTIVRPVSVLSSEEIGTLASDISRILELLPHYRDSLLSNEARQRLAMLVDTFGTQIDSYLRRKSLAQPRPRNLNDDANTSIYYIDDGLEEWPTSMHRRPFNQFAQIAKMLSTGETRAAAASTPTTSASLQE